jgi:two-component system, chemotaxis family, chemotaxis protein CheY
VVNSNSSEGGESTDSTTSKADKIYTILLVDDDSGVRDITEARLALAGFRVVTAVNGLHAMQRLKGAVSTINLIITDLHMPGQNGINLISNIKASPEFKHIPIIALTGNVEIEMLKAAKINGAQEVLLKPVSFQALLDRIQQLL